MKHELEAIAKPVLLDKAHKDVITENARARLFVSYVDILP
jgi:hypothetical protein